MDLFQNLYAVESINDIFFLKFGLYFSLLFLLPYFSLLLGSSLFSLLHATKSRIYKDNSYFEFSKYLVELPTKKMLVRISFGILPFFGVVYFYSQLFSSIPNSAENIFWAFLLFIAGICLTVIYKNGFTVKDASPDNSKFKLLKKGAWFGFLMLMVSSYLLISLLQAAILENIDNSFSIFGIIFTSTSIISYTLFLSISFALTSAVSAVRINRSIKDFTFKEYAKEFSAKTGILFTFVEPLVFILFVFSVAKYALSFSFFVTSMLVLLVMLITSVQFYLNYRNQNLKNTSIVFLFILLFSILIYNNQLTSEKVENINAVKEGKVFNIFS